LTYEETYRTVILNRAQGVNKFPEGREPSRALNRESLINKFANKYVCFCSLFKVSGAWNKWQLLKGVVAEKRL